VVIHTNSEAYQFFMFFFFFSNNSERVDSKLRGLSVARRKDLNLDLYINIIIRFRMFSNVVNKNSNKRLVKDFIS
jgi:hypothetical protein